MFTSTKTQFKLEMTVTMVLFLCSVRTPTAHSVSLSLQRKEKGQKEKKTEQGVKMYGKWEDCPTHTYCTVESKSGSNATPGSERDRISVSGYVGIGQSREGDNLPNQTRSRSLACHSIGTLQYPVSYLIRKCFFQSKTKDWYRLWYSLYFLFKKMFVLSGTRMHRVP